MTHTGDSQQHKGMQGSKKKRLYTIGQISELCNIPKKQLRYYDQSGILSPRYRSAETRYRYYTEEQIEEVLLLQELKGLKFSLGDIGQMIANRNLSALRQELEKALAALREEILSARMRYDKTVDILLRISHGMTAKRECVDYNKEIKLVEFDRRIIFYTRYISYWNADSLFISRRAELLKMATEQKIHTFGSNMAIFHSGYLKQFSTDPDDMEGDLEVCFNTAEQNHTALHCRALGPFKAVSAVFVGHYRNMKSCYLALEEWAQQRRIELENCAVEEYLVGATMTDQPDDYMTRIYVPVKGSQV